MARVVWTVTAARLLEEIGEYVQQESPAHAREIVRDVYDAAERLADFPESGPRLDTPSQRDLRQLLHRSYRIIYRALKDEVRILLVVHGARDLEAFLRQQPFDDEAVES